jgi:acetoin utilization deacetylase AcuC-like enzyme
MIKVVYHPLFETHYPTAQVESPERVSVIKRELEAFFPFLEAPEAKEEDLLLVHSPQLVAKVKEIPHLYQVALRAVGGAILASRIALGGEKAFGLIRPPGHHARREFHWGFCFFNNVAIAVKKLLEEKLIKSAMILDIDLHYGDGTADIFSSSEEVKVVNIQEENPQDFIRETEKALTNFKEEILAISAGFDRYKLDWGRTLNMEDYYQLGKLIKEAVGNVPCFAVLEGGYYLPHLGKVVRRFLEGLSDP